jgi:dTDP-4-amino-4,6-dideoxygalactose transaminase/acetyltransferase-like isoleucine patch superfamily enzyme
VTEASPVFIHPTAEVEEGASIGAGTKVWHLGHVRGSARIGAGCTIGRNVYVDGDVTVGDDVKIQNNVSVYKGVTIEDKVFVGPSAVFTNDLRPRATGDWAVTPTLVRTGASIGANATLVCGVTIGEYAMVAAGAVVTKDVAPHQLVAGNPARPLGWVNRNGEVVARGTERPSDEVLTGETTGSPNQMTPIPITRVVITPEQEAAVLAVLRSGGLAQGPVVKKLEDGFAELHGVPHAVAVSNGTVALVAALEALRLGPGDEVITTAFSFAATLNAILESGATVRFADITDDYTIDPAAVEALVTPRTKAIMPVHLYGLPADMTALAAIAEKHGLKIIEDAAQAHAARIGDRSVGSWGVGCFSLYATKNMQSGEGGIVTTTDDAVADRLRLLRNQGMRVRYMYEVPGHNWRLTDLQAAIAVPQLATLADTAAKRAANAATLNEGLRDVPGLVTPTTPAGRTHVWHQYTLRLADDAPITRDQLTKNLEHAGIGFGLYYPRLMHHYECYEGHPQIAGDLTPTAERAAANTVSVPVHQWLSADDLARIVAAVRGAFSA